MFLIIGLIIFGIMMVIHLYFCYNEQEKARKITKPFLMSILLITCLCQMIHDNNINYLVLLAIALGLVGDILLILNKDIVHFTIGGISFGIGHICYLIAIIINLTIVLPWYFYLITLICLILWFILTFKKFQKFMGIIAIGCSLYSFALIFGISLGIIALFDNFGIQSLMLLVGFIIFFISDTILVYSTFVKNFKRPNFYIMLTYLIAQVMLILGIILN